MNRCEGPLLFLGPHGPAAPAAQGLCEAALQSQAHSPWHMPPAAARDMSFLATFGVSA